MDVLPVNVFSSEIDRYVNQVYYANKVFTITKGTKPVAVLVPISLPNRLATLEKFQEDTLARQQQVELTESEANLPSDESEKGV